MRELLFIIVAIFIPPTLTYLGFVRYQDTSHTEEIHTYVTIPPAPAKQITKASTWIEQEEKKEQEGAHQHSLQMTSF